MRDAITFDCSEKKGTEVAKATIPFMANNMQAQRGPKGNIYAMVTSRASDKVSRPSILVFEKGNSQIAID